MDLDEKAREIIKKLELPDRLSKYGKAYLVGNIAFETTVKTDIDIQVYAKESTWPRNAQDIITDFKKIGITKYIQRELKKSNKYLISFTYQEDTMLWTIDITQTEPNNDYLKDAYRFYVDYKTKMTNANRLTVFRLKDYFNKKGLLHDSMSYYIYRAVIDEQASTAEGVYKFIARQQITSQELSK